MKSESVAFTSLDKEENNRNRYCGRYSLCGKVDDSGTHRYVRLNCKTWKCAYCAPRKAIQVRAAIAEAAVKNQLNKLLTLTLDPKRCSAEESAVYIKQCWNKFRVYLERLAKAEGRPPIKYIQVMEFQKSGYAHLHILINHYIPHDWIKEAWQSIGGGRIVDIRPVDIRRIPNYLSKYLTKQVLLSVKGKLRRYTTSRSIKLFVKKISDGTWKLVKSSLAKLRMAAGEDAFNETEDRNGELRAFSTYYSISECYEGILVF